LVPGPAPEGQDSQALQKREPITIAIISIVGTAALTKLTEIAIEIGTDTIKNLGEWNEVRNYSLTSRLFTLLIYPLLGSRSFHKANHRGDVGS
jgi:hypothetical protein